MSRIDDAVVNIVTFDDETAHSEHCALVRSKPPLRRWPCTRGWHAYSIADASHALQEGLQAAMWGRMQRRQWLLSWLELRRGPWLHLRAQHRYTALCLLACPQALLHDHMAVKLSRPWSSADAGSQTRIGLPVAVWAAHAGSVFCTGLASAGILARPGQGASRAQQSPQLPGLWRAAHEQQGQGRAGGAFAALQRPRAAVEGLWLQRAAAMSRGRRRQRAGSREAHVHAAAAEYFRLVILAPSFVCILAVPVQLSKC